MKLLLMQEAKIARKINITKEMPNQTERVGEKLTGLAAILNSTILLSYATGKVHSNEVFPICSGKSSDNVLYHTSHFEQKLHIKLHVEFKDLLKNQLNLIYSNIS